MLRRQVGRSGLRLSRLALGTMTWGSQIDAFDAADLLSTYLDAGGTTIDTAPVYGDGRCEEQLGSVVAAAGVRDRIELAGKCALGLRDGEAVLDGSRGALLDQLDMSLRHLQTDHLDLWQVHRWDDSVPLEETLTALEHAVTTGRARYVGLSNFAPWQTALAHTWLAGRPAGLKLVSNQVEYSMLNRSPERELTAALEHLGMGLLAWSPLGRGVLTGKYRSGVPSDSRAADEGWGRWLAGYLTPDHGAVVEALARAADGLGVTCAQAALAWLRDRRAVASLVVGARTSEQLSELLASEDVCLPDEIAAALDDVSRDVATW